MPSNESASKFQKRVAALRERLIDAKTLRHTIEQIAYRWHDLDHSDGAIRVLWNTCYRAMVIDLAVCWDAVGKATGSIPAIADCIERKRPIHLQEFLGPDGDAERAKQAARQATDTFDALLPALNEIRQLRDKFIAHQDWSGLKEPPTIPTDSLVKVETETDLALKRLSNATPDHFSTNVFDDSINAGVNLVEKLRSAKKRAGKK